MVGLAEAQVLPLEKCSYTFLERKREGQRGKRERDRWGAWEEGRAASAAVRRKLTSSVTSSTFTLEAWPHFKFLSSLQTQTSLPSPKSGPTAWSWGQFSPLVLKSFIWKRTGKDTAQRAHTGTLLTRISRTGRRQPWAPQPRSTPARLQVSHHAPAQANEERLVMPMTYAPSSSFLTQALAERRNNRSSGISVVELEAHCLPTTRSFSGNPAQHQGCQGSQISLVTRNKGVLSFSEQPCSSTEH